MLLTITLQLLLPVGLLASLGFTRPRGRTDLALRAAAGASIVLALHLAGLWTVLPAWLSRLYALGWVLAAVAGARRLRARPELPSRRLLPAWLTAVSFSALTLTGLTASTIALRGRRVPDVSVVDIRLPFREGRFLVVNGGSTELVNAHVKTLDDSVPRFRAFRGQSYGVDLVRLDRWGRRADGLLPEDPTRYVIHGTEVVAPCDGVVVSSRSDRPDMPVPRMDLEVFDGNHVLMDCGEFELLLAHFEPGSVTARPGDRIRAGELLGRVGNSGRSGEPHLHCSAQRPGTADQPHSGDPLFLTIDGRVPVRNERFVAAPGD